MAIIGMVVIIIGITKQERNYIVKILKEKLPFAL